MPIYRLVWEIDVTADSPKEAAQTVADACFQEHISKAYPDAACVFELTDSETGEKFVIDLEDD